MDPNLNVILKQSFTYATVVSYQPNTYSNKKIQSDGQDFLNILICGFPFGIQKIPFKYFLKEHVSILYAERFLPETLK